MRDGILLIMSFLCAGCTFLWPDTDKITKNIGLEVREKKVKQIDLGKLTDFPWDVVYVFGPYQQRNSICRTLQVDIATCKQMIRQDVDEGQSLLVFRYKEEFVHIERHMRYFGDFVVSGAQIPVRREDAKFRVEQSSTAYDSKPWYKLTLAATSN